MTRVAWTRLSGDEVDAVVALLVNSERPTSERILPSRGDGGVDILDRLSDEHAADVYQVKRFTGPLSSRQKAEIRRSLDRLLSDSRWSSLEINTWRLVMPCDSTPETSAWLQGLGQEHGVRAIWHGLTYLDRLASAYPDVIDYYLNGGESRTAQAYREAIAVGGLERSPENLDPGTMSAKVAQAWIALDHDPLFRYEVQTGLGSAEEVTGPPNAVLTKVVKTLGAETWVAVHIVPRCAAALQIRPITIEGELDYSSDPLFENDLRAARDFGAPFTSPPGAFAGAVDAPGGLGGQLSDGTVSVLPTQPRTGAADELLVQILDPGGNVVAQQEMRRTEQSLGKRGMRAVLRDRYGLYQVEFRFDLIGGTTIINHRIENLEAARVLDVNEVLRFLDACSSPNIGRLSLRGAPPERGIQDRAWGLLRDSEMSAFIAAWRRISGLLGRFQAATSTIIRIPARQHLNERRIRDWEMKARLLDGETLDCRFTAEAPYRLELQAGAPAPQRSFAVEAPLRVEVDPSQVVEIGRARIEFADVVATHVHATHGVDVYDCVPEDGAACKLHLV